MLVVDANVIVKAAVQEAGSARAKKIFTSANVLLSPAHTLAEVGEVLARKLRKGELSKEQLQDSLRGVGKAVS